MPEKNSSWVRAVWNGPFFVGPLSRPVSVGDALLKTLEALWRAFVLLLVALFVVGGCIFVWVQIIEPRFFPPLRTQIIATATYDDGSGTLPLSMGRSPFRCSADFPIRIAFQNNSKKTVGRINFSIEGRAANRTTNIVDGLGWRQTDDIIPPGYTAQSCWTVPVQPGNDPKTINYKIEVADATEADANARFQPIAPYTNATPQPAPSLAANAPPSPALVPTLSLGTIKEADWKKIGVGCSCSFTVGIPRKEKLIAGGDGVAFFRLNGKEHVCPAPEAQTLFDGPVSISCGSAAVRVTPFGKREPGFDGHSSNARLHITDTSGTLNETGTWGCAC